MDWKRSGTSRKLSHKDEFSDILLSWALQDILDENLYKNKVQKIPESFGSVGQYLASHEFPLLEEIRAELASAIEAVYKAPLAEVTFLKQLKRDKLLYKVKVDRWRQRTTDRSKEPYMTLRGDIVVLSDSKPESASDLQVSGRRYTFAFVKNICDDGLGDHCTFKVKTAASIEVGDQQKESLYVFYLINTITHERIWDALRMQKNLKIIQKVLTKNNSADENCEFCLGECRNEVETKFGSSVLSKLNESQLEAVLAAIGKSGCSHRSSVELIWGPPGTGKTSTLSSLLYILSRMNVKTVICAPTNIAITQLASRVASLVRNSVTTGSKKRFPPSPLGDMLIFGNKDRLKVGSDIEDIFLDYRVEKLVNSFQSQTGWKHCVESVLDFLEDCVSQHRNFVDNEVEKSKECDDVVQQSGSKSFLEFARDRFRQVVSPLRRCMLAFLTHLSRRFINEQNYQTIVQLISVLDSIEMLLFKDRNMTSNELESVFLQKVVSGSESCVNTTSLTYMRSQCVSILRSLQVSLRNLGFPKINGRYSVEKLCFQEASLIFCTISSSYKLHSVKSVLFNLLVIDEAAQVKECETTIALQLPNVRHVILVGDECQLPATVVSKLSEGAAFGRSLFERLSIIGHPKHLLNVQYRMHPSISRFPNINFYDKQILDAPNVQSRNHEKCYLQGRMFGPYSFINVRGGREEVDDVGHSMRNAVEVSVIVRLVQKVFEAWKDSKEKLSIGLISPYAAQVAAINQALQPKYNNLERFTVKVKSVDGFQGGEEDIIIISTVRSNNRGSIGFLSSLQRTNVALTRARHCLWILGNEKTLSKSDSVWKTLVSDAKDRRCFFTATADEVCGVGETVIDVNKELEHFQDLHIDESTLFKDSRWQVLYSDNFQKSFHELKVTSDKKIVVDLLVKLSKGWRPTNINVDKICDNSSYILKQFKVGRYNVVCTLDIIKDSIYKQVLKVWDILPMSESAQLFKRLDRMSSMYTDDFINHCNDKLFEGNLEVPKSWSSSSDIIRFKNNIGSVHRGIYVEKSGVSESLLLMKFYSLSTFAAKHLLSDLDGQEVDFSFENSSATITNLTNQIAGCSKGKEKNLLLENSTATVTNLSKQTAECSKGKEKSKKRNEVDLPFKNSIATVINLNNQTAECSKVKGKSKKRNESREKAKVDPRK